MAENVQITPGVGVTIGADSVFDGTLGNAQIQYIKIMDGAIGGTNKATVTANGLAVDGSGVTQPISAISLPLPTGAATEVTLSGIKADTDNLDVLLSTRATEATLLAIKSQTDDLTFVASRLLVDGSGVTQPVSGTVTANQGGVWSVGRTWALNNGTDSVDAVQSGTWDINDISGTISLPTGASTSANQTNGSQKTQVVDGLGNVIGSTSNALDVNIKSGVTLTVDLDQSTDSVQVYGNDGTSNQPIKTNLSGQLETVVVSSALPSGAATETTLSNVETAVGQLTFASTRLLVDGSGVTQPISGSVTANQGGVWTVGRTWSLSSGTDTVGSVQSGVWTVGRTWSLASGTDSVAATQSGAWSTGRTWTLATGTDSIDSVQSGTWNINNISGTISLPTGAATSANQTNGSQQTRITDGTNVAGVTVANALKVDIGTSALTANQGTPTSIANSWPVKMTDGTNILGTLANPIRVDPTGTTTQPVSGTVTANAGTGNFTVVQATGTNLHAVVDSGSITVANATLAVTQSGVWSVGRTWSLASGTDSIASVQSGTWTVQPGNTANTTPWLTTISQGGNSATVTAANALKVDGSAVTQPVSGTVTSNQGTANTIANAWPTKLTDGTNTASIASNGSIYVGGVSAVGVAPSSNPVSVSGVDGGGLKRALLTDTVGAVVVTGKNTNGTAITSNPVVIGGVDDAGLVQRITADDIAGAEWLYTLAMPVQADFTKDLTYYSTIVEFTLPSGGTESPMMFIKNPTGNTKVIYIDDMQMDVITKGQQAICRLYFDPTSTANGTGLTISSTNIGGSAPASVMQAFSGPTITANGTKLRAFSVGTNSNSTIVPTNFGIIVQPNHTLLITGNPTANNVVVAFSIRWAEVLL